MHGHLKKLPSFRVKASFGGPRKDPNILQSIERGNMTFVHLSSESELTTERRRNTLDNEIYQESLIGVAVDKVHCVTERGCSSNNKSRSPFQAFLVWYFRDSRNCNYAPLTPRDLYHQYGISGRESQTSSFSSRTSVVAGANERRLYSLATSCVSIEPCCRDSKQVKLVHTKRISGSFSV